MTKGGGVIAWTVACQFRYGIATSGGRAASGRADSSSHASASEYATASRLLELCSIITINK